MDSQEIFLPVNLKFLRNRKKLTQEVVAQHLAMSRDKLKAIETGKTVNPSLEDVIRFSRFYKMAIDTLLTVKLSNLGELKLRELEGGSDVYQTGSRLRVLAITTDSQERENIEYVSVKAKAGYRAAHSDPQYLATLPKFNIPNLPTGTFRMFPTVGDSMLPIPQGSEIIARYVQDWKAIKHKTLCIVVLNGEQDIVFKEVSWENESLRLHSLNKLYESYLVEMSDVLEIWEYYSFHSKDIPEPAGDLDQVINEIRKLEARISKR